MNTCFKTAAAAAMILLSGAPAFAGLVNRIDLQEASMASLGQEQPLDCADAAQRADDLEASILDLKARYWAGRLRKGISVGDVLSNPAATITSRDLRARFLVELQAYYKGSRASQKLSPEEVNEFLAADRKAFRLHADCGL